MEYVREFLVFAKKYWQVLAIVAVGIFLFNSRSGNHSYSQRLRAISPNSEIQTAQYDQGTSFGGRGEMAQMEMASASLGKGGTANMKMMVAGSAAPAPAPVNTPLAGGGWLPTANAQENAMLIRNGNINAYVDNIKTAKQAVAEKIKKQNARVDNEDQRNEYNGLILSMTIKVSAKNFQTLYDDLLSISDKVNSNSINVDDITKEYVDIKSRLENKKVLQDRFRDLAKRAGRVADVLEVERELARVSEDIDSTTKLMKQYETDVAYSTIYLYLTEPKANNGPGPTPVGFIKKIGLAFKAGFDWVLDTVLEFISWWPMILIAAGGYWYWRRKKKKK